MSRCLRFAAGVLVFVTLASNSFAVDPDEMLSDKVLEGRARALTQQLRCVVCQNQSVDDSDAPLAKDIRVLVRERIAAGDSDKQVRDYIVARYGKFVLLNPPLAYDTAILWLGPFILFAGALAIAGNYIRRRGQHSLQIAPLSEAEEESVLRRLSERSS